MDEAVVKRPFDPEGDQAFLYATWRNQAYYSAHEIPKGLPKEFFKKQNSKIKEILESAQVNIACLKDSPKIIIGYSVVTGSHLNFIYVKESYRNTGVGKLLTPKNIETVTDQLTKIGKLIADKKNLKLQGEINGNHNRENR